MQGTGLQIVRVADLLANGNALAQDGLGRGPTPLLDEVPPIGGQNRGRVRVFGPESRAAPSSATRKSGAASAARPVWSRTWARSPASSRVRGPSGPCILR